MIDKNCVANKDWYLGLDIGSNSVGYSATDLEYNILTKGGKLQCGARLFEDAQEASTRRGFRSVRRRIARRKVRIDLLQELFNSEVSKKDPSFFVRLNESRLLLEDKSVKDKYPLFNDKNFTDKEYYKKFPTIYHLRKHLLENQTNDIRLLYLACHHLIKYRGHFLFTTFNSKSASSGYNEILDNINECLSDSKSVNFDKEQVNQIRTILIDKKKSNAKQFFDIGEILNPQNDKLLKNIFDIMCGKKISLAKIWDDLGDAEKEIKDELKEFKFSSEKYDECLAAAETILSDEQLSLLMLCKCFYDLMQLDRVLQGKDSVSSAMVEKYNEHKSDLKLLKNFIKKHFSKEVYDEMFRYNANFVDKDFIHASYVNYIGSNITHNKKRISHFTMCVDKGKEPVTATHEDFLKYVEKLFLIERKKDGIAIESLSNDIKTSDEYKVLREKLERKTLCLIHNTKDNSYIPHQLNLVELENILTKQKTNFQFLLRADEYGNVADKIKSLLSFRVPYYVGPLSEEHTGKFSWIVKNRGSEKTKVLPWNFDKIVDTASSGEKFITNMTSKCTYIKSEDVIPKSSLLYQRFMLFNDLNNLKINGNRISQELKEFLFKGLCQTELSLSKAKIKAHLVENGKIQKTDILGKETENDTVFNSSLSSQIKLKSILGDSFDEKMCENIIKWHTVFDDEKFVGEKIISFYGNKLTPTQIEKITKLSFKGWARISEKFLAETTAIDKSTGEVGLSVIKILEGETLNLMELLNSDNYEPRFLDTVNALNLNLISEKVDYDFVAGLYCSPIVKRSIWQAILITKELTKINGSPPKKVFIEVTRGEDKSKKGKMVKSRRKQLEDYFANLAKDGQDIKYLLNEFNKKTDEREFRSNKLYLYFLQLGKCMYSGESIQLASLNIDGLYDIDHIYPQSKIRDDSLTNTVLVKRSTNATKGETYPISQCVQQKMSGFWNMLFNKNLINKEKYSRLIAVSQLSDDTVKGFINRQLVSTNQAVKETANALKALFGESSKVVYSKAGLVSDFRNNYDLVKCREVNNLHHAQDAYLNIVVGNVWDSVYQGYWQHNYTFNEDKAIDKLFIKDRKGIWDLSWLSKIKSYLLDNKKYLDKYIVTTRPFEKKGAFYDQTIHPKGKGQFELKQGLDTKKYGGYKTGVAAYNCLMEFDEKLPSKKINQGIMPKRIKGIFCVPLRFVARYKDDELANQIAIANGIADRKPVVIIPKIPMFSVLEIDGIRYHMRSGDLQCSVTTEWYPDKDIIQIIHDIFRYKKLIKDNHISKEQLDKNKLSDDIIFAVHTRNKKQKGDKKISKADNLKLFDAIIAQVKKPFYANYGFSKKVKEGKISREKFEKLKTYEQMEQLISLLNLITMNGTLSNAKAIGGVSNEVAKYMVGDINSKNVYLITQSVTGLYESRKKINITQNES